MIVIVGLIGTVGWLVYDRQQSKNETTSSTSNSQTETPTTTGESIPEPAPTAESEKTIDSLGYKISDYKTYKNSRLGISFKYPEEWSVREQAERTTEYISLGMDDEATPRGGSPTPLSIMITKQGLSAESRRDVHKNNTKDAGYTTKLESGKYFGYNGYKFTHGYKDNSYPDHYYFVLDTPGEPTELTVGMGGFDYAKNVKTTKLILDILAKGQLGK